MENTTKKTGDEDKRIMEESILPAEPEGLVQQEKMNTPPNSPGGLVDKLLHHAHVLKRLVVSRMLL